MFIYPVRGRGVGMSNWSAGAAQRDSERQELSRLRLEKTVQDRRIIDRKGNAQWAQLRALIGAECKAFNREPGKTGTLSCYADLLQCRISLTGRHPCIVGKFSDATIWFRGQGSVLYEEYWHIKLTDDELDVWLSDSTGSPATIEEIASTVIDALLEYR
jgi:hypothetical protein